MGERAHHFFIGGALEGHDQLGNFCHFQPVPAVEFLRMAVRRRIDGDLDVLARETLGNPALRLAPVFAFQRDADKMVGQIVVDPVGRLGKKRDGTNARLLVKLAARCLFGLLSGIDATLG